MERDLIALGLRFRDAGSETLTWGDLRAIVTASPAGSALYVAMSPGSAGWTADTYVAADLFDAIQANTYTVARANGGKPRKPKPYPRPGVKTTTTETKRTGSTLMTYAEAREWFGWDSIPLPPDPKGD